MIDWVSRFQPQPFNGKHALLLSAWPSMVGGNRGLWALRVPLEHLGERVYPSRFRSRERLHHRAHHRDLIGVDLPEAYQLPNRYCCLCTTPYVRAGGGDRVVIDA